MPASRTDSSNDHIARRQSTAPYPALEVAQALVSLSTQSNHSQSSSQPSSQPSSSPSTSLPSSSQSDILSLQSSNANPSNDIYDLTLEDDDMGLMQSLEEQLKAFRRSVRDHLNEALACACCLERMTQPYVLVDCGHTFCLPCLVRWWQARLGKCLKTHGVAANTCKAPYDPKEMKVIFERNYIISKPYKCPSCTKRVRTKPVQSYVVKEVLGWLNGLFPAQPLTDADLVQNRLDLDDLFFETLL